MKKVYVQPKADLINFSSLDDFLTTSYEPEVSKPDKPDLEQSQGEAIPGKVPGIW